MSSRLHRFIFEELQVRGEWVSLQSAWQDIRHSVEYPKAVQQVLGEALAAVSLLMESLKIKGSLSLQISGAHPVNLLVVQATSEGGLRGIARWDDTTKILDTVSFSDLFGISSNQKYQNSILISVEPKEGGERYQSLVSLQGSNLAECLEEYFSQSEQLKTKFWLVADENKAVGFMLQSMPEDDQINERLDDNGGWQHATVLAETLTDKELLTLDISDLLYRLYHQDKIRLFDEKLLKFACSCSQQKIESTILSLGETEATSIIKEQGNIIIDCEFCNAHYELDRVDVKRIFATATTGKTGESSNLYNSSDSTSGRAH